ncbi:hypothetical protein [Dermatophilus congolensis]|uniref:hypothetical protein n=1 Tax=Dermatophilus congolensis TaxID=1863 RepID=UPI001AAE4465|nr:hypothetical protein [Dermatophilus congolensis]MBO3201359.1 hypothetical protein [Dermatophilus congolensis]MBO3217190.1 hypothetical protein [Dermatophilus congolensis]
MISEPTRPTPARCAAAIPLRATSVCSALNPSWDTLSAFTQLVPVFKIERPGVGNIDIDDSPGTRKLAINGQVTSSPAT